MQQAGLRSGTQFTARKVQPGRPETGQLRQVVSQGQGKGQFAEICLPRRFIASNPLMESLERVKKMVSRQSSGEGRGAKLRTG